MPTEELKTSIMYVHDSFNNESWHYASSLLSAEKAHRYHFWGNEGLTKALKEPARVVEAPTVVGTVVCLNDACCSFAGVPMGLAKRLNTQRLRGSAGQ